ncbi:hypothetical protein PM082_002077 [Marasmius tenuissimus]|nr:hypothetical protein PM082_002077 [Marasmius tenuissimus]
MSQVTSGYAKTKISVKPVKGSFVVEVEDDHQQVVDDCANHPLDRDPYWEEDLPLAYDRCHQAEEDPDQMVGDRRLHHCDHGHRMGMN